jgi:hypothetical protein
VTPSSLPTGTIALSYINGTATNYAVAANAPAGGTVVTFRQDAKGIFQFNSAGNLQNFDDTETLQENTGGVDVASVLVYTNTTDPARVLEWSVFCNGTLSANYPGETGDQIAVCTVGSNSLLAVGLLGNFTAGNGNCQPINLTLGSAGGA